jgi:hypothetical protein
MSTIAKGKKTKEELTANRLESKRVNGELLKEVMLIQ